MPQLISTATGEKAKKAAADAPPFGPGFASDVVAKTETLEVYGSSFSDPGGDYCLFKAFDNAGQLLGEKTIGGY